MKPNRFVYCARCGTVLFLWLGPEDAQDQPLLDKWLLHLDGTPCRADEGFGCCGWTRPEVLAEP